ncbi:Elongation of fatty acids protein 3-like [Ananas comosus]|uniref:Elongation of fatty acids protein 3-like n=1 Tax=Ananas comosus TaxID=4615 RepID=A0A199W8Y7_ANACO|nr:Elongation of fatty acids protein 3-like [Ananas comosus]
MRGGISYWLSEHPAIVGFRWGADQLWLATWPSLIVSLSLFAVLAVSLHFLLNLLGRSRPVPLGPIPALHSLAVAAVSAIIFVGTLLSTAAEIRDTRWSWRRLHMASPLHWLLCFPVGTRPSGRVFFWSYAFYLSRYLHLPRALFAVLRRRRRPVARVAAQCALVAMPFLWLEFSQSFQVLAILAASLAHVLVFGYRFWICAAAARGDGAAPPPATVVMGCQVGLLWCNVACHVGVLVLHFGGRRSGGCSGIGAWAFNSVLNAGLLWIFLDCYAHYREKRWRRKAVGCDDDCGSTRHWRRQRGRRAPSKGEDKGAKDS